jgi:hypothetical protein
MHIAHNCQSLVIVTTQEKDKLEYHTTYNAHSTFMQLKIDSAEKIPYMYEGVRKLPLLKFSERGKKKSKILSFSKKSFCVFSLSNIK